MKIRSKKITALLLVALLTAFGFQVITNYTLFYLYFRPDKVYPEPIIPSPPSEEDGVIIGETSVTYVLGTKTHCIWGPAVLSWKKGHKPKDYYTECDKEWYTEGVRHRINGPAVEHTNGYKEWWVNGVLTKIEGTIDPSKKKSVEEEIEVF